MANSADPDLQKPTDLDLRCLQRQDISGFSRTRVKGGNIYNLQSIWGNVFIRFQSVIMVT